MNERLKSSGKQVFVSHQRRSMEWVEARRSFINENVVLCLPWLIDDVMEFFFTLNRIWSHSRREKTDIGGAQLPPANGSNRSRARSTCCTEHARNALGWRIGRKSSTMGQRVHISTRSESIFRWVQAFHLLQVLCTIKYPVNSEPFTVVYWWSFNWN